MSAPNRPEDRPEITIRRLRERDRAALRRLAERDSATVPAGPLLGAEVGDELVAAIPLGPGGGGRAIADPFRPTAAALALLRLRARQIHGERGRGGGIAGLLRSLRRIPRARGAIAGSPPGGGSRLLEL